MPEPADRPPLRDQIAEALPCPVCPAQAGDPCVRAREDNQQPHMSRLLRADAVMHVVEAETAALRQRAEKAERERNQARDAIATERRGRLAAEAAVRRVRQVLARKTLLAGPQAEKAVRVADVEAALNAEQPKETP